MSLEAMKLAAEFNRYFTSANGVDVRAKVSVTRDEWRVLFTAIQQAEAQQPATPDPMLSTDIAPRPLSYSLDDYHRAPSEGALHYTWQDKPHRLLYDLIAAVAYYAGKQPATGEPAATKHEAMASALAQLRDAHRCNMAELRPTEVHRICFEALEVAKRTTPEPWVWPLRAQVWKRESTQEWVMEIAGTLGGTDMNVRHTQPLSVAYESVPGLPTLYTHPAPSVPDDVVRDAAQEAVEELHKLNEYAIVYINDPEWTRVSDTCQKLIGSIDAAMLAT